MAVIDVMALVMTLVVIPYGAWVGKKVINHDRIQDVQAEKLAAILEKIEDIRAYLRENRPIV